MSVPVCRAARALLKYATWGCCVFRVGDDECDVMCASDWRLSCVRGETGFVLRRVVRSAWCTYLLTLRAFRLRDSI